LDGLREKGYRAFHDVVAHRFNVDHILIGPGGIYAIETKTFSKPARGQSKIIFDGESVLVEGFEPDRNPVIQARAQASWVREIVVASTGRDVKVRPVILFPGWYVEKAHGVRSEIWVLNENAFPQWLGNERTSLSADEINLVALHLGQFVRSGPR